MSSTNRNGKRKSRIDLTNRRKPELGYYFIFTDTEGTERVYFEGLNDSIKDKVGDKLIIKVRETKNGNMIKEAKDFLTTLPQYAEPWIVFDKDKNEKFDKIIEDAKCERINVAWSNPCFEIWLHAYFGNMPTPRDSVSCCRDFSKEYKKCVGQDYKKADTYLYKKISESGNEDKAIEVADRRFKDHIRDCKKNPSDFIPGTTVYRLVKEIKDKTK